MPVLPEPLPHRRRNPLTGEGVLCSPHRATRPCRARSRRWPVPRDRRTIRHDWITVFGDDYPAADGTCVRDYIPVEDRIDAHLRALRAVGTGNRIYNLGNGHGVSVRKVIQAAERVTGRTIPVEAAPRRPGDPAVLVAGSDRIRQEQGWMPKCPDIESWWRRPGPGTATIPKVIVNRSHRFLGQGRSTPGWGRAAFFDLQDWLSAIGPFVSRSCSVL